MTTPGSPNRHLLRLWVVQFLFQRDFNRHEPWEEALEVFLADKRRRMSSKMRTFFEDRVEGTSLNREEIDAEITRFAENWEVDRMGAVDRNVLRLAFFELKHCPDVPPVVVLNEAVQLAKELSSEESGKFVNGILDPAIRVLDRPLRQGVKGEDL